MLQCVVFNLTLVLLQTDSWCAFVPSGLVVLSNHVTFVMSVIFPSFTVLTIENFIKLSWRGMDDKVGCYAYLHTESGYGLKLEINDQTNDQKKTFYFINTFLKQTQFLQSHEKHVILKMHSFHVCTVANRGCNVTVSLVWRTD